MKVAEQASPVADPVTLEVEQRLQHLAEERPRLLFGEFTLVRQHVEQLASEERSHHEDPFLVHERLAMSE